jgi:hypothetical protein
MIDEHDLDMLDTAAEDIHDVVAELRYARMVVAALQAWESMDGMFFGHTPEEGGDVGRALIAYEQAVGS